MSSVELAMSIANLSSVVTVFAEKISSLSRRRKKLGKLTNEELISELVDRMKKVAPSDNMTNLNPAQIALTSKEICGIS